MQLCRSVVLKLGSAVL